MILEIKRKTAIEIANTLIESKYISLLQHAIDMGIKGHKVEMILIYNLEYI